MKGNKICLLKEEKCPIMCKKYRNSNEKTLDQNTQKGIDYKSGWLL